MIESFNAYYSLQDIPSGFLINNNKKEDYDNEMFLLILLILIIGNDNSLIDNDVLNTIVKIFLS